MYAEKSEILAHIVKLRPDYTLADIDNELQNFAVARINGALASRNVFDAEDVLDLLKFAEISIYMELAGMLREVESVVGILEEEAVGNYKKTYKSGMPMFFFAAGTSKSFMELLPHETYRMMGYRFVRIYVQVKYVIKNDKIRSSGYFADPVDSSERS